MPGNFIRFTDIDILICFLFICHGDLPQLGSPSKTIKSPTKYSAPLRDFSSVFHNDESRHGLDPNQIFCPTPGTYLGPQKLSKVVKSDGITETKTVPFSPQFVPFGDRIPTKQALPTYDPKYESPYIRSAVKQGTFDKSKRIEIPTNSSATEDKKEEEQQLNDSTLIDNNSSTIRTYSTVSSPSRKLNSSTVSSINFNDKPMSMYEYRCSLVPLPKLKMRHPEVMIFDASSYKLDKDRRPISLTPNVVKQKAKVQLYDKILSIPRRHKSSNFPMKVTIPLW